MSFISKSTLASSTLASLLASARLLGRVQVRSTQHYATHSLATGHPSLSLHLSSSHSSLLDSPGVRPDGLPLRTEARTQCIGLSSGIAGYTSELSPLRTRPDAQHHQLRRAPGYVCCAHARAGDQGLISLAQGMRRELLLVDLGKSRAGHSKRGIPATVVSCCSRRPVERV